MMWESSLLDTLAFDILGPGQRKTELIRYSTRIFMESQIEVT